MVEPYIVTLASNLNLAIRAYKITQLKNLAVVSYIA